MLELIFHTIGRLHFERMGNFKPPSISLAALIAATTALDWFDREARFSISICP
jgi:hypothetical protein